MGHDLNESSGAISHDTWLHLLLCHSLLMNSGKLRCLEGTAYLLPLPFFILIIENVFCSLYKSECLINLLAPEFYI